MNAEITTDNRRFIYAFTGALFFIAAMSFIFANLPGIVALHLPYTAIAGVLAAASLSLLYKALKNDKERLRQI